LFKKSFDRVKIKQIVFFLTFELDQTIFGFLEKLKILGKIIKYFDFFAVLPISFENISLNIGIPLIETRVPIGTKKTLQLIIFVLS